MAKKTVLASSNSGVHAQTGFDFQRNTCLYLFLDQYETLKDQNYFIMLEHYDDIIFAFVNSKKHLTEVASYQAKKSADHWTTNSLFEIIDKITSTGIEIKKDPHIKTKDYQQKQYFVTNSTIALDYKCSTTGSDKTYYIHESNEVAGFSALEDDCKARIRKGNGKITYTPQQKQHLEDLHFSFIDLGRKSDSQLALLAGKLSETFGESIADPEAARDTLLNYLRKIERTFNQGHIPRLDDDSKRLASNQINEIIGVLTTEKLALDACRAQVYPLCKTLQIPGMKRSEFISSYKDSIEQFKDLTQGEHQKIFKFVASSEDELENVFTDEESIKLLYELFKNKHSSTLTPLQIKAAISAAYYYTLHKK